MRLAMKEPSNYLKHSNQTPLSLHSSLVVTNEFYRWFSLNTDNKIADEGAIKLFEALKSNSSLNELNLWSNSLIVSFQVHAIQVTRLAMKEPSYYLKHSN
jgi:hypothetical protein